PHALLSLCCHSPRHPLALPSFPTRRSSDLVGDVVTMRAMKESMHPLESEPLETGRAGTKLQWAERLAIVGGIGALVGGRRRWIADRKSTRLNSSHVSISYAVFCLKKKKQPR